MPAGAHLVLPPDPARGPSPPPPPRGGPAGPRGPAALRARFPNIVGPKKDDICYATQNRQDAVKTLASQCDAVIVVGSPTSSNSNRLREVAKNLGVPAYMVDDASEIDPRWVLGTQQVGVTAGASAPEILVRAVIDRLEQLGIGSVSDLNGVQEKVGFPLPKGLV